MHEVREDGTLAAKDFEYEDNIQFVIRMVAQSPDDASFCEGVKRLSILLEPYKDDKYRTAMENIQRKLERTNKTKDPKRTPNETILLAHKLSAEDVLAELMKLQYRKGMLPKQDVTHLS